MQTGLSWRAWLVLVLVTVTVATVTFLGLIEIRQVLVERQQLREVVELIRSGRIQILPPPPPQPQLAPAEKK